MVATKIMTLFRHIQIRNYYNKKLIVKNYTIDWNYFKKAIYLTAKSVAIYNIKCYINVKIFANYLLVGNKFCFDKDNIELLR